MLLLRRAVLIGVVGLAALDSVDPTKGDVK